MKRSVLLLGAAGLSVAAAGGYAVMMSGASASPEAILGQFIRATIRNDFDAMARAAGAQQSGKDLIAQQYGRVLGQALGAVGQAQALDEREFSWVISRVTLQGSRATADLELRRPDVGAQAAYDLKLEGPVYNAEGTLVDFKKPPAPTPAQLKGQAAARAAIPPLKFRLPIAFFRRGQEWFVDPESRNTATLTQIIRQGDLLTTNTKYLVKP
jgi:hypothetical protein